jgi:hypothetical protein
MKQNKAILDGSNLNDERYVNKDAFKTYIVKVLHPNGFTSYERMVMAVESELAKEPPNFEKYKELDKAKTQVLRKNLKEQSAMSEYLKSTWWSAIEKTYKQKGKVVEVVAKPSWFSRLIGKLTQ